MTTIEEFSQALQAAANAVMLEHPDESGESGYKLVTDLIFTENEFYPAFVVDHEPAPFSLLSEGMAAMYDVTAAFVLWIMIPNQVEKGWNYGYLERLSDETMRQVSGHAPSLTIGRYNMAQFLIGEIDVLLNAVPISGLTLKDLQPTGD